MEGNLSFFRRERDNLEAERAQQLKQIRDFQEHVQEKERQFGEFHEQVCGIASLQCVCTFPKKNLIHRSSLKCICVIYIACRFSLC